MFWLSSDIGSACGTGLRGHKKRYVGEEHRAYLRDKIVNGGVGVWGSVPMPPMPAVDDDALQQIVAWLTSGDDG